MTSVPSDTSTETVETSEVGFSSLPFDVAVSIVEKHLPDPADLAVLRAVSKGMRAAVDATGRKLKKYEEYDAVERGYLSTLKCLRRRGRLSDERLLCAAAARIGDLEALKALRSSAENLPWDGRTCAFAAIGGHLELLKWARENGCPLHKWTCWHAAKGGHLEMLKWLRENECLWPWEMTHYAARNGHIEVMQWLHENGCPWNWLTCADAARGGHLETLKWARENGCPWNKFTCWNAAEHGHLEVLKWAHANGCPGLDAEICWRAQMGGHLEVVRWLNEIVGE
jgi:hypothetical protein